MKKKALIAACVVVAALILSYFVLEDRVQFYGASGEVTEGGNGKRLVKAPSNLPTAINTNKNETGLFSHLPQSRIGMPLDGDPFAAQSREDQMWLDRNGFPNARQWEAYNSASPEALDYAAANGDVLAGVFSAGRKVAKGDTSAVSRLLKESQESGSLFALSMLQSSLVGSDKGGAGLAYTISRISELQGDPSAIAFRELSPQIISLPPEARLQAEADAQRLISDLKKTSRKRPFFDPRPTSGK